MVSRLTWEKVWRRDTILSIENVCTNGRFCDQCSNTLWKSGGVEEKSMVGGLVLKVRRGGQGGRVSTTCFKNQMERVR